MNLNPAFIKKLNLLQYCFHGNKVNQGEYDILCLSLFRSYRFAEYEQSLCTIHKRLGKGVRKVIPSCGLWSFEKNILQPIEVISILRKAMTKKMTMWR